MDQSEKGNKKLNVDHIPIYLLLCFIIIFLNFEQVNWI